MAQCGVAKEVLHKEDRRALPLREREFGRQATCKTRSGFLKQSKIRNVLTCKSG